MRLSTAIIVRNEVEFLPECLASIAELTDEICVVDTGSTDGTLELARAQGCITSVFRWTDDFSAARNASLDLCTGDWVFVIDADERLAPESIPVLRGLLGQPRDRGFRLTTRNFTNNLQVSEFVPLPPDDPAGRGFAGWFPSVKVRLFPRHPAIRFENRVHEVVTPSLVRLGYAVMTADVPVLHYPLLKSEGEIRRKQELYLALGKAKLAEQPGNARAHAELGSQYLEIGDLAGAAEHFREAVRHGPDDATHLKDLGGALFLMGRVKEAERALRIAVARDPTHVDAWRNLGVVLARQENWVEALHCFEHALGLSPADAQLAGYRRLAQEHLGS